MNLTSPTRSSIMPGRAAASRRAAGVLLASMLGGVLLMAGLHLGWRHPAAAMACISAGQLVWMRGLADPLCPRALPGVTGFLQYTAALVCLLSLGMMCYHLWQAQLGSMP